MSARWLSPAVVLALGGCQSTLADLEGLAEQDPLPYSVLVTGGTFEEPAPQDSETSPLDHTFGSASGELGEAIPLTDFVEVLRVGRVFVRVAADDGSEDGRREMAALEGPVEVDDRELQDLLARARTDGHDLLLVVQRLQDGAVEEQGINGSWPITLSVWLLLGLGMFIPDHTFESQATVNVSLRDVQTGRVLYDPVQNSGPVDLSLVERGSVLGIIGSIIIPPFWVPNDDENTVESVREVSARRLLLSVARQLKGVEAQQQLGDKSAALITPSRSGENLRLRIEVPNHESLAVVRMRLDSRPVQGAIFGSFEAELLASATPVSDEGLWRYEATYPVELQGELLQILVQTASGLVASETVRLADL